MCEEYIYIYIYILPSCHRSDNFSRLTDNWSAGQCRSSYYILVQYYKTKVSTAMRSDWRRCAATAAYRCCCMSTTAVLGLRGYARAVDEPTVLPSDGVQCIRWYRSADEQLIANSSSLFWCVNIIIHRLSFNQTDRYALSTYSFWRHAVVATSVGNRRPSVIVKCIRYFNWSRELKPGSI